MKRHVLTLIALIVTVMAVSAPTALAAPGARAVGPRWLSRLDPGYQIPEDLALKFANAAVAEGLTPGEAAKILNDERFAMALGSPDQGYGMLEALIAHPERIPQLRVLLQDHTLTSAGADSVQNALMDLVPQLRNAYLKDLGLRAVMGPAGVLVLVDIETGKQVIGQGRLGAQIRAPGGGPLPLPVISPDAQADQILAVPTPSPSFEDTRAGGPNISQDRTLMTPWIAVGLGIFVLAWAGFGVGAIVRRRRARALSGVPEVEWHFEDEPPNED